MADEAVIVRGTRVGKRTGRRPRTKTGVRVGEYRGCETRLSRYNRSPYCYLHAPLSFPRTRGKAT